MNSEYTVIGLMSGTSLDGLDIALCRFWKADDQWRFNILNASTIAYSDQLTQKLSKAVNLGAEDLILFDRAYGKFLGEQVNNFLAGIDQKVDLIASHGHTVFHQPEKGYTLQIGSGSALAAITALPVVADFRSADVALGGQGAPLVPIGDELLFSSYDACLNLGGFSNISFREGQKRVAFDICPVNIVLNSLSGQKGLLFDKDGMLAATGKINKELLFDLNSLSYYKNTHPKSLGTEWLDSDFIPVVEAFELNIEDKLRTVVEHIALQVANSTPESCSNLLLTGGGAKNTFLVERIKNFVSGVVVPSELIIDYKEALIFAFLGLLRYKGEVNCLASVTGASRDSVCGTLHSLTPLF